MFVRELTSFYSGRGLFKYPSDNHSHSHRNYATTKRAQNRLDEIGTEEKLPLPEWEWEQGNSVGGIGGSAGGHSNGHGGSGQVGGGMSDGRRSSADEGGGGVSAKHIHARVSAEGRTRVLLISSHKDIRRTISAFGAKEASLARQQWQSQLVLDKYRR